MHDYWGKLTQVVFKIQSDIFCHTEIGTQFNKEAGWIVGITLRTWPDKNSVQQFIYLQLTPYIHPPLFPLSHFFMIQLDPLPFPAFGPCLEHALSSSYACIVSSTQSHKLSHVSHSNFTLSHETHESLVSLLLSVTKVWLNFFKIMCRWFLPWLINHLSGPYYCLSCLLIKVWVSVCWFTAFPVSSLMPSSH